MKTRHDPSSPAPEATRRALLRFLLGSPLLLAPTPLRAAEQLLAPGCEREVVELIASAAEAVDVFDFEPVARQRLLPAHYTYLSMGVQHEVTLRANRTAFEHFQLRPRMLAGVRDPDTSTEILGTRLSSPILLAPVASQRTFHAEAELAVARAARARDHLMILSTGTSTPIEEVAEALGEPPWFQLYTMSLFPGTRLQLREAEGVGCPAVVLTVDMMGDGANRDRIHRYRRAENPECQPCHASRVEDALRGVSSAARFVGVDLAEWWKDRIALDWDYVDRIRDATPMKLLVKGILTPEDASLRVEHSIDGIVVSNHGGRAVDSGLSTIEVLPEIARAVDGRISILLDSGFRRGTDVFKALALGASAVCVGRPYLWGLSAFGQEGVEAVLGLLRAELRTTMRGMGAPTLAKIAPGHVRRGIGS